MVTAVIAWNLIFDLSGQDGEPMQRKIDSTMHKSLECHKNPGPTMRNIIIKQAQEAKMSVSSLNQPLKK